jgi:hypothetical protein
MKYVLGNMLNGGGGLNADGLALDLQFAADKTLTARKGPTPVFTRASSGTFVGSNGLIQSAAINIPRFDHTSAGVCRGLLIEESRTNVILQSETIGTTWTQTNISVSSNVAVSPDGNTTADKIVENTASAIHGIDQSTTFTAIPYTFSFYAKKDGRIWVRAFLSGLASTWFNIDNGTVGTVASGFTASISSVGNGWYRCSITGTASAGTLSSGIRMATGDGINTYLGDGTSGIFLWGAQLEAGSFATSYIPTVASSVVRSADVCSITGTPFSNMWNTAEGTMYASGDKSMSTVTSGSYFSFQAGGTEVGPLMTRTSTQLLGRIRNNAGSDVTITDTSQSPSGEKKLAVAWVTSSDANTRDFSSSGVILTKSNPLAGTAASNQTTMIIGSRPSAAIFNGTISTIRYYRKRLPNSKLVALTT